MQRFAKKSLFPSILFLFIIFDFLRILLFYIYIYIYIFFLILNIHHKHTEEGCYQPPQICAPQSEATLSNTYHYSCLRPSLFELPTAPFAPVPPPLVKSCIRHTGKRWPQLFGRDESRSGKRQAGRYFSLRRPLLSLSSIFHSNPSPSPPLPSPLPPLCLPSPSPPFVPLSSFLTYFRTSALSCSFRVDNRWNERCGGTNRN